MVSFVNMEKVPTKDHFKGFNLILETIKVAQEKMIQELIDRSKVTKVMPMTTTIQKTSSSLRECSIEIETFR